MDKIIRKKYYKIKFRLVSPLSIGSGNNIQTDKDIMLDSRGIPFIPASAIAGVSREYIHRFYNDFEKSYFGNVSDSKEAKEKLKMGEEAAIESLLIFYDAHIIPEDEKKFFITARDQVKLDECKTAIEGAKFDMQALEPGIHFVTYLEQNFTEGYEEPVGDYIAAFWKKGRVLLGAKSMRGYGAIDNVEIGIKEFFFQKADKESKNMYVDSGDVLSWLNFDMYTDTSWKKECFKLNHKMERRTLQIGLKQVGGISVRTYSTLPSEKDLAEPDYMQMSLHHKKDGKTVPVIPGTSWAGAFRHHIETLIPGCIGDYFGTVEKENKRKVKSKIRFSETELQGSNLKEKILSRNAIDRISGGSASTALFTEQTYYGGRTVLDISYDDTMPDKLKCALAAAIEDLHWGFLAVGGETSIGRGLFHVTSINGFNLEEKDCEMDKAAIYHKVLRILQNREE